MCFFVKQKGLKGIMYWEYNSDGKEGASGKAAYEGMQE